MYNKKDALMTKGMAILCMVMLHLFCRKGNDVLGTPLLWVNKSTPVVYFFGFFSQICVPIYSLCAGYAQQLISEKNNMLWKNNLVRVKKLIINYWSVLLLFCGLGLIFSMGVGTTSIPGSLRQFLKSIVLLHSYNGAWWYLNTYIIMMLAPPTLMLLPITKLKSNVGLIVCLCLDIVWYFIKRFDLWINVPANMPILSFVEKELYNLLGVLPFFWIGAFLCKGKILDRCKKMLDTYVDENYRNVCVCLLGSVIFVSVCVLEKAIFIGGTAVVIFVLFNLWKKNGIIERIFCFLGKHSTNIWLTHMFFYLYLFVGLVEVVRYPIFMLIFIFILCVISSCVINKIENILRKKIFVTRRKFGGD